MSWYNLEETNSGFVCGWEMGGGGDQRRGEEEEAYQRTMALAPLSATAGVVTAEACGLDGRTATLLLSELTDNS